MQSRIIEDLIDHAEDQVQAVIHRTADLLEDGPPRNTFVVGLFARFLSSLAQDLTEHEMKSDTPDETREAAEALLATTMLMVHALRPEGLSGFTLDPVRLDVRAKTLARKIAGGYRP